jgi:TonB family protein
MKTKGTRSSVLKNGMPFFANLQKGTYRITVSKAGYRQSADNFKLDCSERNKSLSIELYSRKQSKSDSKSDKFPVFRMENKKPPQGEVISEPVKVPPPVVRIPKPTPNSVPKVISGGVVNGKATKLVQPIYPAAARAVKAKGAVNVQVTIDEQGNVISANAVSGHPLLRAAAVQAARASKFSPTMLSGQLVKVTGVIVYNFVP